MDQNVTYDRPMPAKLVVELADGTRFDATDADLTKFGFVDRRSVYRRFSDWLYLVHPEAEDLTRSPLNPFRYAAECAAHYDHMPTEENIAQARALVEAALALHLVSEHGQQLVAPGDAVALHDQLHDAGAMDTPHDRDEVTVSEGSRALAEEPQPATS